MPTADLGRGGIDERETKNASSLYISSEQNNFESGLTVLTSSVRHLSRRQEEIYNFYVLSYVDDRNPLFNICVWILISWLESKSIDCIVPKITVLIKNLQETRHTNSLAKWLLP